MPHLSPFKLAIVLPTLLCSSFISPLAVQSPDGPLPTIPKAEARTLPRKKSTTIIPTKLSIPSLKISASVQHIGLLADGQLDVPASGQMLGWYELGAKPGARGNAIIDGHLTTSEGPGTFWTLKNIKAGDLIEVEDESGKTLQFKVRKTAVYHVDHAPMEEIFGKTEGKHLNLITCAGRWNTAMDHYEKRLIVYSDLVE